MNGEQLVFDFMKNQGPNRIYFDLESTSGYSSYTCWRERFPKREGILDFFNRFIVDRELSLQAEYRFLAELRACHRARKEITGIFYNFLKKYGIDIDDENGIPPATFFRYSPDGEENNYQAIRDATRELVRHLSELTRKDEKLFLTTKEGVAKARRELITAEV